MAVDIVDVAHQLGESRVVSLGMVDRNFPSDGMGFSVVPGNAATMLEEGIQERNRWAPAGQTFGCVVSGSLELTYAVPTPDGDRLRRHIVEDGEYFSVPNLVSAKAASHRTTVGSLVTRHDWLGLPVVGGPIEGAGRLRYIDGCTDTLLVHPPRQGDPCLNHLHFPPGIDQTMHTHPSVRFGSVMRGRGICESVLDNGEVVRQDLRPGMVWCIHPDGEHRFITRDSSLDVIAYHPDTDWGPQDEEHPMLNRTLVDGERLDNTAPEHQIREG